MATTYIALGTNLGDRAGNLREALERLSKAVQIERQSAVYETEPWGVLDQPRFLNMVVAGETELTPSDLLHVLKQIEREMGRTAGPRYGPRVIDLDILFFDAEQIRTPELTIPHPRLAERRFVLVPLAEIAPDLVHPETGLAISRLLEKLPDDRSVKLYAPQRSQ